MDWMEQEQERGTPLRPLRRPRSGTAQRLNIIDNLHGVIGKK